MTIYKMVRLSDSWKVNEVHVSRISDTIWGVQAKLENGRVPTLILAIKPTENDEPKILAALVKRDRKDRLKELFERLLRKFKGHCDCCEG